MQFVTWNVGVYNAMAAAAGLPQINVSGIGGASATEQGGATAMSVQAHGATAASKAAALPSNLGAVASPGGGGGGTGTSTGKAKAASNKLTAADIAQVVKDATKEGFKLNASLMASMTQAQQYAYIQKEATAHNVKVESLLQGLPQTLAQYIEYSLSSKKSSTKAPSAQAFTSERCYRHRSQYQETWYHLR